ncbi:MAG: hypothetical protein IIW01_04295, partial [Thermoguttaceae bacterium]|nr:hypothetical protein [Thermoguttaceae bacterium]
TGENVVELARSPGRTTGKEVALFWGAARLAKLETKLTAEGSVGDGTALELSRALRSDSSAERKKILTEASARVADWAKTLRREETAARILSESWRFDAAAQRRTTLVKRAERENRALLARFAGRLNVDFNASFENDELEEGKRRFDALWREANAAEKECVAIVDRLRERLQSESAQDFIEFVGNVGLFLNDWSFENVEADETTARAIDEMTSQNETRRKEIAKNVENNRFGRAAERLKSVVASLEKETAFIFDESGTEVNVDEKDVVALGEMEATNEIENGNWSNSRRFSALAALLTWGVDEKRTRKIELQTTEKEDVALASTETESVLLKKDARTAEGNDGEKTSSKDKGNEDGSLSQKRGNGEEKESKGEEKKAAADEVSVEKISGSNVRLGEDLGTVGGASGEESKNENGANAAGRVGGEGKNEEKNVAEILENKAFNAELPFEARRRFEETDAPEILPEYEEKIRRYRRRILEERR